MSHARKTIAAVWLASMGAYGAFVLIAAVAFGVLR